jgi:hypothetical protein
VMEVYAAKLPRKSKIAEKSVRTGFAKRCDGAVAKAKAKKAKADGKLMRKLILLAQKKNGNAC